MLQAIAREVFKRELVPPRARWWLAAAGMRDRFAYLRKRLAPHLGDDTERILASAAHATFARRLADLARHHPRLEAAGERGPGLVFGALYRVASSPEAKWIFTASGGAPRSPREWIAASRLVAPMDGEARWREVTVHLGELLIVLTDALPDKLPHARKVLGDICFDAGVRYAKRMKRAWKLPDAHADAPALAIEVLRTSEYLFRVNPEHWGGTDAKTNTG